MPAGVEADLHELLGRLRPVVGALKQGGPPPPELRQAFASGGLGPRHGAVLLAVTLHGQLSVSDLSERLALSLSATSLMVGELGRAGLVQRVEDEHDRRRTLVGLNDVYREQLGGWLASRVDPVRRTLERLTPEERAGFLQGWRVLEQELVGAAHAASAPVTDPATGADADADADAPPADPAVHA